MLTVPVSGMVGTGIKEGKDMPDYAQTKLLTRILAAMSALLSLIAIFLCGGADHAGILRFFLILVLLAGVCVIVLSVLSDGSEPVTDADMEVNGRSVSVNHFRTMVTHIHQSVDVIDKFKKEFEGNINLINSEIESIGSAVQEIAENATSQAGETADLSAQMNDVGDVINETSEQVKILTGSTEKMERQNHDLRKILSDLFSISERTKSAIDEVHGQTNATNASVEEIRKVVDLISGISSQTNLLSLNASIEAARAGEAGKGFAVVADEVRALAEQSNESAKQIGGIVEQLIANSNTSVQTMESVLKEIDLQNAKLADTREAFDTLNGEIDSVAGAVSSISDQVEALNTTKNAVTSTIDSLSGIAQANAASTEETSASLTALEGPLDECNKAPRVVNDIAAELRRDAGDMF